MTHWTKSCENIWNILECNESTHCVLNELSPEPVYEASAGWARESQQNSEAQQSSEERGPRASSPYSHNNRFSVRKNVKRAGIGVV